MTTGGLETTAGGGMRTFTAWEPLEVPMPEWDLDELRAFNAVHGLTAADVRSCFAPDSLEAIEADAMVVAEKVAGDDEWLCQVCGGTSRTCECKA